jgi:hypothetical protein
MNQAQEIGRITAGDAAASTVAPVDALPAAPDVSAVRSNKLCSDTGGRIPSLCIDDFLYWPHSACVTPYACRRTVPMNR